MAIDAETKKKLNKIYQKDEKRATLERKKIYWTERPFLGLGKEYIHIVFTGVRGIGKSVLSWGYVMNLRKHYGADNVKCFFFRLSTASCDALLANNARQLIDQVTIEKYSCEITRKNNVVYDRGKQLCEVLPLMQAAKNKGLAKYDYSWIDHAPIDKRTGKKIKRFIILMTDEFEADSALERQSIATRSTAALLHNYYETILRNQKQPDYPAVRCFYLANKVSEASNFLYQFFNFAPPPDKFGIWKNKRRNFIMYCPEPSEAYIEDRKKSIMGSITRYDTDPNYTNKIAVDATMIKKKNQRINKITYILKFSERQEDWFTVYDSKYIRIYRNERVKKSSFISMVRNLNTPFILEVVENIWERYELSTFIYCDWKSLACFRAKMRALKVR